MAQVAEQLQQSLQQDAHEQHVLLQAHQAALADSQSLRLKLQHQQSELKECAVTVKQLQGAAADLADELQAARFAQLGTVFAKGWLLCQGAGANCQQCCF